MYFLCSSMYCLFCVIIYIVCVYMCTILLPPGGYPIAVKYIVSCTINYRMIVFYHETICDMCCSLQQNFPKSTFIVSTDLPRANRKNLVISLWKQFENPQYKANNLTQTSYKTNFKKLYTNNTSIWREASTDKSLSLQTDDLIWKTHNENIIFKPN
jgi:hypothetical protein